MELINPDFFFSFLDVQRILVNPNPSNSVRHWDRYHICLSHRYLTGRYLGGGGGGSEPPLSLIFPLYSKPDSVNLEHPPYSSTIDLGEAPGETLRGASKKHIRHWFQKFPKIVFIFIAKPTYFLQYLEKHSPCGMWVGMVGKAVQVPSKNIREEFFSWNIITFRY